MTTSRLRLVGSPAKRMFAGFIAALLVAEVAIRLFGAALPEPRNWYHDIAQAKSEQLDEMTGADLDMLFAGTSQTYYAIGPHVIDESLGTKSYNAAVPAGVPPIQERWLVNQVLERVDTDVVVWGLSVLDVNDGRDLSVVDAYASAHATRTGRLADAERSLARWSGLFRYRRQLVDPSAWAERTRMDAMRSVVRPDGQRRPAHRTPSAAERDRIRRQIVSDYQVGGAMMSSLRRTIEAVEDHDIDVVLVWLPVPERLAELLPAPHAESTARREVGELARDLDVPIVDVSEGFGNDDFLDYTHLGEAASERLSKRLSTELAAEVRRYGNRVRGMVDKFSGFPGEAIEFLEDLELHNERDWFHAHKDVYDRACRRPMERLVAELSARYDSGKMFRIQRDIRFSNDKTPYKTNLSATFGGGGYVSLSPDGLYVGTGGYMLDGERLKRYREAVGDDGPGKELVKITSALGKKGYDVGGHGEMKVVQRGFHRDHPRADLLRQKSVFVGRRFDIEPWLATRKALDRIHKVIADARPMTEWIGSHLDRG